MFTKTRGLVLVVGAAMVCVFGMAGAAEAGPNQPFATAGLNPYTTPASPWQNPSLVRPTPSTTPVQTGLNPSSAQVQRPTLPPANLPNPGLRPNLMPGQDWWRIYPWSPYNIYNPYNPYSPSYNRYYPYYPCSPYNPFPYGNPYPLPLPYPDLGGSFGIGSM